MTAKSRDNSRPVICARVPIHLHKAVRREMVTIDVNWEGVITKALSLWLKERSVSCPTCGAEVPTLKALDKGVGKSIGQRIERRRRQSD